MYATRSSDVDLVDFILPRIEPSVGHLLTRRMPSSEKWRRVGLVRTDVSEELVASFFRVEYPLVKKLLEVG
jgi:hypothetical protein